MSTIDVTSLNDRGGDHSATRSRSMPIVVCVVADDPLRGDRVTVQLREFPSFSLLPTDRCAEADVVVVVAAEVTDQLLTRMGEIRAAAVNPKQCLVLVADMVAERFLARVVAHGVVSVLAHGGTAGTAIAHVVVASANGRSVLSPLMARLLVDHCRSTERVTRTRPGSPSGDLTRREVDILYFLADGKSVAEIADRMAYSERTIKNVVQELLERMNFRNRTEAVAYAIRVGAM